MNIEERRSSILNILKNSEEPISASKLGSNLGVSRQIIVNDVAFLRALGEDIISTNRGYIVNRDKKYISKVKVKHLEEEAKDELYTIVDNGGKVLDVYIEHDYYGRISASLKLSSRRDIDKFLEKMEDKNENFLTDLTDGIHYHTISAKDKLDIDAIKKELGKLGILIK